MLSEHVKVSKIYNTFIQECNFVTYILVPYLKNLDKYD